jgi:cytochrome c-type biogenesis protein CcmH
VTTFILICAVMIIAAVALLAVPLTRRIPSPGVDMEGTGAGKHRGKRKGVKVRQQPDAPRATSTLVVAAIVLPLAAVAFYHGTSNFPWQNPLAAAAAPAGHAQGGGDASLTDAATQLEARLAENPQDAEGWRMLGRTYLVTSQPAKAVTAYERAVAIAGAQDPGLQLDLAEALVLTDDPAVQGRAQDIIEAAIKADPNNGKALWYSAVMAVRAGDTETAKANFEKLLEQNPPPEIRQIVVEQLAGLGVQVPAAEGASTPAMSGGMGGGMGNGNMGDAATASGRTLRVAVSLDPSLASKLKPGTPLFVAARQPGIPGPPLAAVRLSSDELPTTVVLSDANSMIEGRNLSSVDDVEVIARVAFGGTAVPEAGDLVGSVTNAKGGPTDVAIVIDKVAP